MMNLKMNCHHAILFCLLINVNQPNRQVWGINNSDSLTSRTSFMSKTQVPVHD